MIDSTVSISAGQTTFHLPGLSHSAAQSLHGQLTALINRVAQANQWWQEIHRAAPAIRQWWTDLTTELNTPRWIPESRIQQWLDQRPKHPSLEPVWLHPHDSMIAERLATLPPTTVEALTGWATLGDKASLEDLLTGRNTQFARREKQTMAEFFATVEKSPLTDEQIEATIRFDNRVRVIASAGSGKTSTMVAKAGYAALRDVAAPHQILLLAFNKKAAVELQERIGQRLGDTGAGITARTFHAFGLHVIGEATRTQTTRTQRRRRR